VDAVDYQTVIGNCDGEVTVLPVGERRASLQQWREVFAAGLHAATGFWTFRGYEWHIFSYDYAQALNGLPAMEEYLRETPQEFFVIPEDELFNAFRIVGGMLPDLRPVMDDVVVWPANLDWTMAFTHEESIGLGPYFSRREWLAQPPPART
jgi:Domain of unknown function (DUF4275)